MVRLWREKGEHKFVSLHSSVASVLLHSFLYCIVFRRLWIYMSRTRLCCITTFSWFFCVALPRFHDSFSKSRLDVKCYGAEWSRWSLGDSNLVSWILTTAIFLQIIYHLSSSTPEMHTKLDSVLYNGYSCRLPLNISFSILGKGILCNNISILNFFCGCPHTFKLWKHQIENRHLSLDLRCVDGCFTA